MHNTHKRNIEDNYDEVDLKEIFEILIRRKWTIMLITLFFSVTSVIYSFNLPNLYESKAILIPQSSGGNAYSSFQNYSDLANLAGINIPSQSSKSNPKKAKEKLKSFSFFENNILPNIFLPELMAVDFWDAKLNKLEFKKHIYNESSGLWAKKDSKSLIPSTQNSFNVFQNHIKINEDVETGFIILKIKHQSPHIAKRWVELIVSEINHYYSNKDKKSSESAINFLNQQIAETSLTEIKQVLSSLLQQETQKLMLAESSESYVYEYLDPPIVMEGFSEPRRDLIFFIITFLGALFGILVVLIRHYVFQTKDF